MVVESLNILLPQSPYILLSSPLLLVNLLAFKNLHNFTSSTNRLLRAINFALQHTSRTNRLLRAVNFSLKYASGSNGLLGAVDHLGELELLGGGVVGEHFYFWVFGWVGSECVFCFCWGSVNEWMRKKKMDGGEGRGGLCRVGWGFEGLVGG